MALTDEEEYLHQHGQVCDLKRDMAGIFKEFQEVNKLKEMQKKQEEGLFPSPLFIYFLYFFKMLLGFSVSLDNICYSYIEMALSKARNVQAAPSRNIVGTPLTSDTVYTCKLALLISRHVAIFPKVF